MVLSRRPISGKADFVTAAGRCCRGVSAGALKVRLRLVNMLTGECLNGELVRRPTRSEFDRASRGSCRPVGTERERVLR